MHIFLTGASGFIGKNLVPYLLERNCQLTCLLRDPRRLPKEFHTRVRTVQGNLESLGAEAREAMATAKAIVHLAGQPWGRTYADFDQTNREGTRRLVQNAKTFEASLERFVYISTVAAAGPAKPGETLTEVSIEMPISWYGKSKLAGERELEVAGFPWTVLRVPAAYGPYDQDVLRFFRLAAHHIATRFYPGHLEISLIHVLDVCQAIWLVLTKETRPVSTYFINDGQPIHNVNDVLYLVAESVGKWTVPVPVPLGLIRVAELALGAVQHIGFKPQRMTSDKLKELRQRAWTCSADLIKANLGFSPTMPLPQGISETVAWYRKAGKL
ncbi:MAG: NAD(P)-dependent oxidoreductase [Fidelibacterota bacterium]|nr:MAG: NAD(P)-dependent oxidoreductase [Candidatus Neomarinimicrobiota bacterium]